MDKSLQNLTVDNPDLRTNQRKAIEVLAATGNVGKAAQAADVQRQTVYNWLGQRVFKRHLQDAQSRYLLALSASLDDLSEQAIKTLRDAMSADDSTWGQKIRAAVAVLQTRRAFHELAGIDDRLSELERIAGL